MPNSFALLVLYSYPVVVAILFLRLPRHEALIWSILGGYLFLPGKAGVDLPLLPALNKLFLPSLSAGIMCLVTPETPQKGRRRATVSDTEPTPKRRSNMLINICIFVLIVATVGVFLTNRDPVIAGPRYIGGLSQYDIFSMILNICVMLLPFLLARRYLAKPEAQITLLRALAIGGLVYGLLIVIEVIMSPQLNRWIYGFFPHSFAQHMRDGGFRPIVFLEHGLRVSIFVAMACLSAGVLWRYTQNSDDMIGPRRGPRKKMPPYLIWTGLLFVALVLSKSLGALAITFLLLPVVFTFAPQRQMLVAVIVAGTVLLYPTLRQSNLVPTESIVQTAASISGDRASSLRFRLNNEDILLARAAEKPLFGWGGWGRGRVYDPITGIDLSVTDGVWVISFGTMGWVGYLAQFSLLTLPIFAMYRRRNQIDFASSGLCLVLAANLVDLIPNSGLTPLTWMVAGTILGRTEFLTVKSDSKTTSRSARRARAPNVVVQRSR